MKFRSTANARHGVQKKVVAHGLRIVLRAWSTESEPRLRNVAATDAQGHERWRAELPPGTGRDCFVRLDWIEEKLFVATFSGHRFRLCPATGSRLA